MKCKAPTRVVSFFPSLTLSLQETLEICQGLRTVLSLVLWSYQWLCPYRFSITNFRLTHSLWYDLFIITFNLKTYLGYSGQNLQINYYILCFISMLLRCRSKIWHAHIDSRPTKLWMAKSCDSIVCYNWRKKFFCHTKTSCLEARA